MIETAFIGFGSNLGDKRTNCLKGLRALKAHGKVKLLRLSSLWRTEPVGFRCQDWFLNGVVEVATELSPRELLELMKEVERKVGRKETFRWGPRTLDLDLLLCGQKVVQEEDLQVPHPRLHQRAFVLVPLVEIAPEAYHPILRKTAKELLQELNDPAEVQYFGPIGQEEL